MDNKDLQSELDAFTKETKGNKEPFSMDIEQSMDKEWIERLKGESLQQDISQRKLYAHRTFWFLCVFTGMAFAVLISSGRSFLHLSNSVLIALITSSFASVVSIFILVMRYLFKS